MSFVSRKHLVTKRKVVRTKKKTGSAHISWKFRKKRLKGLRRSRRITSDRAARKPLERLHVSMRRFLYLRADVPQLPGKMSGALGRGGVLIPRRGEGSPRSCVESPRQPDPQRPPDILRDFCGGAYEGEWSGKRNDVRSGEMLQRRTTTKSSRPKRLLRKCVMQDPGRKTYESGPRPNSGTKKIE